MVLFAAENARLYLNSSLLCNTKSIQLMEPSQMKIPFPCLCHHFNMSLSIFVIADAGKIDEQYSLLYLSRMSARPLLKDLRSIPIAGLATSWEALSNTLVLQWILSLLEQAMMGKWASCIPYSVLHFPASMNAPKSLDLLASFFAALLQSYVQLGESKFDLVWVLKAQY